MPLKQKIRFFFIWDKKNAFFLSEHHTYLTQSAVGVNISFKQLYFNAQSLCVTHTHVQKKRKKRNYNVFISVTYLFEDEDMHFVIKPHMSAAAKG